MRTPGEMAQLFRARAQGDRAAGVHLRCAARRTEPPDADMVYAEASRQMPSMSLKTVYQTLNDLAEMGEIHQLELGTGSSRFDPNVDAHHHLVCTGCGKVRDLHADLTPVELSITDRQGFAIGSTEVVFRGYCADCLSLTQIPTTSRSEDA